MVVWLAACGPPTVRLPLPALDDANTLLIVRSDPRGLAIEAVDLGSPAPLVFEADAPVELSAILYQPTLEGLGLSPGPIEAAPTGTCGGRFWSRAGLLGNFQVTVQAGEEEVAWTQSDSAPEAFWSFRRAAPCPCAELGELRFQELPDRTAILAEAVDQDRAAIAVSNPDPTVQVLIASPDGVAPGWIAGVPMVVQSMDLHQGRLYAGGFGAVAAGPVTGPLMPVAQYPGVYVNAMAGVGDRLYTATSSAQLFVQVGDELRLLYDGFPERGRTRQRSVLLPIGSDEVYYAPESSLGLIHWERGRVERIEMDPESRGITSLAMVPGLGVVFGTAIGTLFRLNGDLAEPLDADDPSRVSILDLVATADGFWMSTDSGGLQQYVVDFGLCPKLEALEDQRFYALTLVGDWLLAVGPKDLHARAVWAR
jgi:hypothetical protein